MACKACQQQRRNVVEPFKNGQFVKSGQEAIKGLGMMTGIIPKPGGTRK